MRPSTIVACLLLSAPPSVLACDGHAAELAAWFHEAPSTYRGLAAAGAEESSMTGLRLAGAGLASLVLVAVAFRALSRSQGRARPGEFGPDQLGEPAAPIVRPGEVWIRLDAGHDGPELSVHSPRTSTANERLIDRGLPPEYRRLLLPAALDRKIQVLSGLIRHRFDSNAPGGRSEGPPPPTSPATPPLRGSLAEPGEYTSPRRS